MTQAMVCDSLLKAGTYGAAVRAALSLPAQGARRGGGIYGPGGKTTDYSLIVKNAGGTAWGYISDATVQAIGLSPPAGASLQTVDSTWTVEPLGYSRALVCDGNSLTAGTGASPGGYAEYPSVLAARINAMAGPWYMLNHGVGGIATPTMTTNAPSAVDPTYASWRNKNILIAWEITNDIAVNGATGATAYNNYVTYCQARQAAGWTVVSVNVLPRPPGGGAFVTARAIANASIAANWATFSTATVDLTTEARLSDATNTTYYNADQVHLTDAGYAIVAAMIGDVVVGLI